MFLDVPGTVPGRIVSVLEISREIHLVETEHQNAAPCPAKFLGQLFTDTTFYFLSELGYEVLVISRNGIVL